MNFGETWTVLLLIDELRTAWCVGVGCWVFLVRFCDMSELGLVRTLVFLIYFIVSLLFSLLYSTRFAWSSSFGSCQLF